MNAPIPAATTVRTTCPYCGVGCGVLASVDGKGDVAISGDPDHPANFGRLCSKGSALGETLGLETRLLAPMLRQHDGAMARVAWSTALDTIAAGLRRIIDQHGPDAIAFYLSGQLLTEDYYVANKLMKGFIGSANVDTNSRLCMASSVAGHRRAFGADIVPGVYADLEMAELIVLVGSNAAWCHPILHQRILRAREENGAKVVVIDPRRTATAEDCDLFLGIEPGKDSALFCGLLVHLAESETLDQAYIDAHTENFADALARAREIAPDIAATARATGLSERDVAAFFALVRATDRVVTCFSQGVNQSAQGPDKVNAIINCHLATGRIGKPGAGPFSLTGQPNAMGGREVGGLANQLAAHMNFVPEDIARVARFWNAPNMAKREGLKAVQMFDAIARGEIKALWVMGTNPAVSLPRADAVRAGLGKLELFIVSENVASNDTVNSGAHVVLPAAAWGEKDGTVTNSERRISRQRPFLPLPGEAKPDWWALCEVAKRLGFGEAFAFRSAADIFCEHAALSGYENNESRGFDLTGLVELTDAEYGALRPMQWPLRNKEDVGDKRLFGEGRYLTASGKAQFVGVAWPSLKASLSPELPYWLNTGRVRDQWHTMTRTGLSAKLAAHSPEPFVEVHPHDAAMLELHDGSFAHVATAHGECVLRVKVNDGQRQGSLFAPIHWNDETASSARVGALVGDFTDPYSGQPEAKATPAAIAAVTYRFRGFMVGCGAAELPPSTWWARVAMPRGAGFLFASNIPTLAWQDWARRRFDAATDIAEYLDEPRGIYRMAAFDAGRLLACLFVGSAENAPPWEAIKDAMAQGSFDEDRRRGLLSGRSSNGIVSAGPIVCACFGVGLATIRDALASGAAASAEDIRVALRAGSNCGSCLPEIKRIVARERIAETV